MDEKFFDDLSQANVGVSMQKEVSEVSGQLIRALVRNPDVLPCAADRTIDFWLDRLSLWGKLQVKYYAPDSRWGKRITTSRLLAILTDPNMVNVFGKWQHKKLSVKSVEISRAYRGYDGRVHREKLIVDIDLDPDMKMALKGKY